MKNRLLCAIAFLFLGSLSSCTSLLGTTHTSVTLAKKPKAIRVLLEDSIALELNRPVKIPRSGDTLRLFVYDENFIDTLRLPPSPSALFIFGNLFPIPLLTHALDMQDGKNKKIYTYAPKIRVRDTRNKNKAISWPKKKAKDSLETRYVLGVPLYNGFMFHQQAQTYRYIDGGLGLTLGIEKDLKTNKKFYRQGGLALKISVPVGLIFVAAVAVPETDELDAATTFQVYYGYGCRIGKSLELGASLALQTASWSSRKSLYSDTHFGLATPLFVRFKIKPHWGIQAEYCPQVLHLTSPHINHTQSFSFGFVYKLKQKPLSNWKKNNSPPRYTKKVSSMGRFVL